MTAQTTSETIRIDGKQYAADLRAKIAAQVEKLGADHGITPGLAVVLVGEDAASEVYVRNKHAATIEVGMQSFEHKLPGDTSEADLLALVARLNADPAVNGILVQLPLPNHLQEAVVTQAIDPAKDVDGLHVVNAGLLISGGDGIVPCTPRGTMMLLRDYVGDLSGKHAVVIGRSNLFGKPMAQLLLRANCTVTMAHSRTTSLPDVARMADVLVVAVGQPQMVKADWVKDGAAVMDVGMNRIPKDDGKTRLVGDVDYDAVYPRASVITPVPGGIGPMTVACLLANTLTAACRQHDIDEPAI